uniref:Uncharacterized protein n=1 Tax=Arundo donax TaxID=35708 RepID=A0A0A9DWL2_ARUDO
MLAVWVSASECRLAASAWGWACTLAAWAWG